MPIDATTSTNTLSAASRLTPCRDAVAELQGFLANIFMALMPSAKARTKMHLTGISQPLIDDISAWYFWRDDFPGAFLLELGEADTVCSISQPALRPSPRARFWIKYFPALEDDPAFEGLSVGEQALRLSPLFDSTGTPLLAALPTLPEAAFHVGYLELTLEEESRLIRLELAAQDIWPVRCSAPLDIPISKNPATLGQTTVRLREAGELDRRMPGWPLAWAVLDTVTTALGLFHATIPVTALLWERAGTLLEAIPGGFRSLPAPDIADHRLHLWLPHLMQTVDERHPVLWDAFSVAQPAMEQCEAEGGKLDWLLVQPPEQTLPWLNPLWWQCSTEQDLSDAGLCCLIGHDTPQTDVSA